MKKRFTLIEIIAVIAVLGILATIIIPNISDKKQTAMVTQVNANILNIQTAMDMYSLEHNNQYASVIQPTTEEPQIVDFGMLYPKYLKSLPKKVLNEYYWVDFMGKVWSSTVDAPTEILQTENSIEWNSNVEVKEYNIYQVKNLKNLGNANKPKVMMTKKVLNHKDIDKFTSNTNDNLLISAVDGNGLETAPVGMKYKGIPQDWFNPIISREGTFEFSISSNDLMYWDGFYKKEIKPDGTDIVYDFTVKDINGSYIEYTEDFDSLSPSTEIKIKVTMIGHNGKLPSLLDFRLYYHFAHEDISYKKPERTIIGDKVIDTVQVKSNEIIDNIVFQNDIYYDEILFSQDNNIEYATPITSLSDLPDTNGYIHIVYNKPKVEPNKTIIRIISKENVKIQDINTEYIPKDDIINDDTIFPEKNEKGWETVQEISFVTSGQDGQLTHWISIDIQDKQPDNTRILYYYGTSNGLNRWTYTNDFSKLKDSKMLKVYAVLQVKEEYLDKVENPEIISIKVNTSKGVLDLSTVKPTAVIMPSKNNNGDREIISTNSNITWNYETFDPQNKQIVEVEWGGDKREKYDTPGTYSVTLRVKNELNYWSDTTTFTFEVKDEKPVAVISPNKTQFSKIDSIIWGFENSFDPDGDTIIKAEWGGDYKTKYDAGNYVVTLRVQDNEGHWSDWVSTEIIVHNSIFITDLTEIIDGNLDTHSNNIQRGTKKEITWGENISNRVIRLTYQNLSTLSGNQAIIEFKNDSNTTIPFQLYNSGTIYTQYETNRDEFKKTLEILVPEGATKLLLYTGDQSGTFPRIFEIEEPVSYEVPNQITNISHISGGNQITFNWEEPSGNYDKIEIYRDNVFVGYSTNTTYTDTQLFSEREYQYSFKTVNSHGNKSTSVNYEASTIKDGVVFFGGTPEMFDHDVETFGIASKNAVKEVTWDENLTNQVLSITYQNSSTLSGNQLSVEFKDINNNKVPFILYNANTEIVYTTYTTVSDNLKKTFNVVVPKNAIKLVMYTTGGGSPKVYEVTETTKHNVFPREITNISHISYDSKIVFSWDKPSGDFEKVAIYRDNIFVGYSTENTYTDTPLYANQEYNYKLISIGTTGNRSQEINYKANTIKDGVVFSGGTSSMFDHDLNTFGIASKSPQTEITWDEDLTSQVLSITYQNVLSSSGNQLNVEFKDINNQKIAFKLSGSETEYTMYSTQRDTVKRTIDVIVPSNAVKMVLYATGGNPRVFEIEAIN